VHEGTTRPESPHNRGNIRATRPPELWTTAQTFLVEEIEFRARQQIGYVAVSLGQRSNAEVIDADVIVALVRDLS
jgi:hypothetical protein